MPNPSPLLSHNIPSYIYFNIVSPTDDRQPHTFRHF